MALIRRTGSASAALPITALGVGAARAILAAIDDPRFSAWRLGAAKVELAGTAMNETDTHPSRYLLDRYAAPVYSGRLEAFKKRLSEQKARQRLVRIDQI